ncbi:MAG TPA: SRPBCC domain-containing protein [Terracidiphilus sp.]|nr:SRPBCC domain-containing protein [Terracidiphilus sp.]
MSEAKSTSATVPTLVHSTFVVERAYPQPPDRVFAAFAQPARKRRWYAEGDHEIQEFEMEFRAGGAERFRYTFKPGHPIAGSQIANESTYQDIAPDQRIVMTTRMSLNGKPIAVMLATIEFVPAGAGTALILTHQSAYIEWPEGAQMIEAGWKSLLGRLATALAE